MVNNQDLLKPYSETRAQIIDSEVSKIIENQYKRAKNIIMKNKKKLEKLADQLLKNEVIFKNDLVDILEKENGFHMKKNNLKKQTKKIIE